VGPKRYVLNSGYGPRLSAPYVNNVLPTPLLDPFAKGMAALYPEPSTGSLTYVKTIRNSFDENRIGARMDHRFSERESLFGRYSHDFQVQHTLSWSDLLAPGRDVLTHGQVLALGETHIFRPNLINDARFGFDQAHPYRITNAPNTDLYAELGLAGIPYVPGMPTGLFEFHGNPGIQNIGNRTGFYQDYGIVRDYIDNVTWTKDVTPSTSAVNCVRRAQRIMNLRRRAETSSSRTRTPWTPAGTRPPSALRSS